MENINKNIQLINENSLNNDVIKETIDMLFKLLPSDNARKETMAKFLPFISDIDCADLIKNHIISNNNKLLANHFVDIIPECIGKVIHNIDKDMTDLLFSCIDNIGALYIIKSCEYMSKRHLMKNKMALFSNNAGAIIIINMDRICYTYSRLSVGILNKINLFEIVRYDEPQKVIIVYDKPMTMTCINKVKNYILKFILISQYKLSCEHIKKADLITRNFDTRMEVVINNWELPNRNAVRDFTGQLCDYISRQRDEEVDVRRIHIGGIISTK